MKVKVAQSCQLFATPWTTQSMEFSRPEYWSGEPIPFSRGSAQPTDRTQVSRIAGTFFTSWATREAQWLLGWLLTPSPTIWCCPVTRARTLGLLSKGRGAFVVCLPIPTWNECIFMTQKADTRSCVRCISSAVSASWSWALALRCHIWARGRRTGVL